MGADERHSRPLLPTLPSGEGFINEFTNDGRPAPLLTGRDSVDFLNFARQKTNTENSVFFTANATFLFIRAKITHLWNPASKIRSKMNSCVNTLSSKRCGVAHSATYENRVAFKNELLKVNNMNTLPDENQNVNERWSYFDGVPDRLREERERLRMTQAEMAAAARVSLSTQRRNEKKVVTLDTSYYDDLHCIGVDVPYVILGKRSLDKDAKRAKSYDDEVPEDLRPAFDAMLRLWLSRTVSAETIKSWAEMFDRMNPFMNPVAAQNMTVTPTLINPPAEKIDDAKRQPGPIDPETGMDLSLFSRRPG